MKVTIKDIAHKVGMSVSTVSLALSGKDSRLSSATKQKIYDAAKELNYRRNHMATALVTKKTRILGVILPDISNEFFAKMAKGIGYEAEKNDYRIMLLDTNDTPDKDIAAVHTLLERSVDGILYVHSAVGQKDCASECVEICKAEDIPLILLDRVPENTNANAVFVDQEKGSYMAVKHLLELGHTKIGCITGPIMSGSSRARLCGYIKALQESHISIDMSLIVEGEFNADSGYELTQCLLDRNVTAIFAFNDLIAYGVYRYVRNQRLRVPRDLSLVGFDNINFSEIMEIPLTTVHQPTREMGIAAVQKILKRLNEKGDVCNEIFEPNLIIRKSTGNPRMMEIGEANA